MFIGHYAVGLAAKKVAPEASLGTLLLACQLADLLWPLFLLLGWEEVRVAEGITAVTPFDFVHYPYSHSLLTVLGWGALFYLVYKYLGRGAARTGRVLGAVVVSHWVLDWITHRPDLPLYPGGTARMGLGLWNSLPATLAVEGLLFAAAVWLYLRATRARNGTGAIALWALIALLVALYLANLFGPPPPADNLGAVIGAGLAMWLLVAWGYWIDRNREIAG
ncbi:MAG: metal-dependent hydrolase [bacterium]